MNVPFFPWLQRRALLTERVANIQDQVLELGTHVRFLEADKPKPQPRLADGRFSSRRAIVRDQLAVYAATTTHEQRVAETQEAFERMRAMRGRG